MQASLLRVPFHGTPFRLLLFGGIRVLVGFVTEAFYVPLYQLCVYSQQNHCKNSFLVLHRQWEHRSWAFACFLAI